MVIKMKILIYNWDLLDGKNGGGVVTYIKNLVSGLINKGHDVWFINSGLTYTKDKKLRIEERATSFGAMVHSFEIINSPVIAPSRQSGKNIEISLSDETVKLLFKDFFEKNGPFDVVHFNNLEGIPIKVLELKDLYRSTQFIYSAHNYYPICSRVNLWKDEQKGGTTCKGDDYSACVSCYKKHSNWITKYQRVHKQHNLVVNALKVVDFFIHDKESGSVYEKSANMMVSYLNKYIDTVIAVSSRVKEILTNKGLEPNKIKVLYIGTAVAEVQKRMVAADVAANVFVVTYMGYMRKMKGIDFFIEFLGKIPGEIKSKCEIRIIARYDERTDHNRIDRINKLSYDYCSIKLYNGYTKENQMKLLEGTHLGVVPVLWEDNLPQVAIEQVAYGIPILTSDLGGAQEIGQNSNFVFKANDIDDCIRKFLRIYHNRWLLDDFYRTSMNLISIEQHSDEILRIYNRQDC